MYYSSKIDIHIESYFALLIINTSAKIDFFFESSK